MRDGDTESAIVGTAVFLKELLQVVYQQRQVHSINACCCHCSIVQLWAAAVRHWIAYDSKDLHLQELETFPMVACKCYRHNRM